MVHEGDHLTFLNIYRAFEKVSQAHLMLLAVLDMIAKLSL